MKKQSAPGEGHPAVYLIKKTEIKQNVNKIK
jgi:hypothetical protein